MIASLNCLSCFTLLESPTRIPQLVQAIHNQGYDAIALMDKNHLYALHPFLQACHDEGIQPLVGLSLEYKSRYDEQSYYISLLAKDNEGLEALYHLSTKRGETEEAPFFEAYAPFFNQHLFYMTSGSESEIEQSVFAHRYDQAKNVMSDWQRYIKEPIYFALPTYLSDEQLEVWKMFQEWMQWPFIACNEVKQVTEEERFLSQVLRGIAEDKTLRQLPEKSGVYTLLSASSFQDFYQKNEPLALEALNQVADFKVTMTYHQERLPHYPVQEGMTAQRYLKEQCDKGKVRVETWTTDYEKRLDEELSVIHEMGFDDYFLIVWDVMREARHRHILTAPGRGSAAGSLVAYLLHITDVDPLKYHLLFERFLNKNRKTMPDIDLDFPDYRRDEMYVYLAEKYGYDKVARIITFGTLAAKQVMRDVTRVFGLTDTEQMEWVRAVKINQHDVKVTLKQAYEDSYPLRALVQRSDKNKKIFQTALALEGLPKNSGMHAAGVILTNEPLVDMVPLQKNDDGLWITQWPMTETEALGLLKMDFLGLRNLTIIDQTLKNIDHYHHESLDLENIPLDDPLCYEAFSKAYTLGVFQFESRGMRRLLQRIQPKNLEDLSLINAIHRPGPSLNSDDVVRRRFGKQPITYIDKALEPILSSTYGLMIYQEQVMQVAQVFAGYSLAEADNFRRAMSKKNREQMEAERQPFLEHAQQQGRQATIANQLFEQMMAFAGYGFNKSHSIAYSILAYRMMYLKVHYPSEFYLALLKIALPKDNQLIDYIYEMQYFHCQLVAPSLKESHVSYTLRDGQLQMGFLQIKGIDKAFATALVNMRENRGIPTTFEKWISYLPLEYQQERFLVPLIEAGLFDDMEPNRHYLLENLEAFITNAQYVEVDVLQEIFQLKLERVAPFPLNEQLRREKERLGAYLITQPLQQTEKVEQMLAPAGLTVQKNQWIRSIVIVTKKQEMKTKKHENMARYELQDRQYRHLSAVLFPDKYRHFHLEEGEIYLVEGHLQTDKYGQKMVIDYAIPFDNLKNALHEKRLYLKVPATIQVQNRILQCLRQYPGTTPVAIIVENTDTYRLLNEHYWVTVDSQLLQQLTTIIDEEYIRFQ